MAAFQNVHCSVVNTAEKISGLPSNSLFIGCAFRDVCQVGYS